MGGFEVSSIYVGGVKKALEPLKLTAPELATLSAAARQALEAPNAQRWFPGEVMFEVLGAVATLRGFKAVTDVNVTVTAGPLVKIIGPLLRVALAFSKTPVSAAMTRMQAFSGSSLKNVTFDWKETSANTGELVVSYDIPAIPHEVLEHAWRGVFEAVRELISSGLRLERSAQAAPNAIRLHFVW